MIECIILVLAAEALTKLMRDAEILSAPRVWLSGRWALLDELMACGYCLSVWAAGIVLALHHFGLYWIVALLALHRAANMLHDLAGIAVAAKIRLRMRRD